jgi:diadenosine tetraphosphatase ApaH/serine/threonine PP2A family protein phosphatase
MRYAVVSDIHSNWEAFAAVLDAAAAEGVDGYLCLGDLVGYGPDPDRVIAEVQERSMVTVRGNHDHAAFDAEEDRFFNDWAREAIAWTRDRLSTEDRDYLARLGLTASIDGALLVHAAPSAPRAWRYVLSAADAQAEFPYFDETVCFIGHSHVPMVVAESESGIRDVREDSARLSSGVRHIINVGSVGQPRDGDPRASFGIYDPDQGTYRLVRVDYDVEATSRKILDSGLPPFLGTRLLSGR